MTPADAGSSPIPSWTDRAAAEAIFKLAATLTREEIPEEVFHDAKRLLLIGVACSILGRRWPENPEVLQAMGLLGGAGHCTVFGMDVTVGCRDAVFLNALHAQVHDGNDGLSGRGAWHAGRVLVPAVCGVAEHRHASGRALLVALVLGYEVAHRAFVGSRRCRCEGVGLAAMLGQLLGLPREAFLHAIYLTEQHAPRLYPGEENIRVPANHLCSALIARTAVESTFLAEAGMSADPAGTRLCFEQDLPRKSDPSSFLTRQVYLKPYLACRYTHCAIESALAFRASRVCSPEEIEKVQVRVAPGAEFVRYHPKSGDYYKIGQFSIPYTVACALQFGEVGEKQFSRECRTSDVMRRLQRNVEVEWRTEGNVPGRRYLTELHITLKDGRRFSESREFARGSPQVPLSDAEVIRQFEDWTGDAMDPARKRQFADRVFGLEAQEDVGDLFQCLRSSR